MPNTPTIRIENSYSTLIDVSRELFIKLRHEMSYKLAKAYTRYRGGHRSRRKYLLSKKGIFPTGLLHIAKRLFSKHGVRVQWVDARHTPKTRLNTPRSLFLDGVAPTPYPEQLEAVKSALNAKRGIVVAPTGLGKSLICGLLFDQFRVKTLIVVPTLNLKYQLRHSFNLWFGEDIARDWVKIENIDALDADKPEEDIGLVIIDEFHHSAAKSYRELNTKAWNKIYHRVGLTATPFRSNSEENILLESILAQVIYQVPYLAAVAKGYIVPAEAYYLDIPKTTIKSHSWRKVYSDLVVNNEIRNKIIRDLLLSLQSKNIQAICLVKEIKHGENLIEGTNLPFINSLSEDRSLLDQFNNRKIPVLVGTTGVLGEGVDTKPAEVIIIAGLGKSKNQFMQQCGRGFRVTSDKKSCTIIIFSDKSHMWIKKHFACQIKYLQEEYNIIPAKLEL